MTHPIKLLQVMTSKQKGGAENFFARLYNALSEQASIKQYGLLREQSPYLDLLSNQQTVSTLNFSQSWNPFTRRRLQTSIRQINPDIVMTWMNRPSKLVGDMWQKKNYVHIARLGGFYDLKNYQHCDHLIANTQGIADYLIQSGVPKTQVHLISNFINEIPGNPVKRPAMPLIVAVGRLHRNKAFDTLIHAVEKVPNAQLWIIGDGPERQHLETLIRSHHLNQRVKLLGWQDNPQDYLATADVFVCPSRHEPLGNVILEAWFQQVPIIATRSHGAIELIHDGENGCLCDIDDVPTMATCIRKIIDNKPLQHQLSQAGLSTYLSNHSKAFITQQYINLFNKVIR